MNLVTKLFLGAFAVFVLVVVLAKSGPPRVQTKYQECIEAANHMRSTNEADDFKRNLCERLPVEAADLR